MVYLDNAATTYPKPPSVISGASKALVHYGGNPGRSGHTLSMETAEQVFLSRVKCAEFFGAQPENVIFTLNCTHALNLAIKGIAVPGAHYIISDLEHNAVVRPVHAVSKSNRISYSVAQTSEKPEETVRSFEKLITPKTRAIVCTAASNVTGRILPYKAIGELCARRGICFILDAAQGAGVLPIALSHGVNIICAPGHKGLYGPMGTGLMITDGKYRLSTLIEGGTGSASHDIEQPEMMPDRFESGTINTSGAIALGAGVSFVREKTIERIHNHEHELCRYFFEEMKSNMKVRLYSKDFGSDRVPIVPFNIIGHDSTETAALLNNEGFFLRGGFHCAFFAHKRMGTTESGAVRFAPSVFTSRAEVTAFVRTVNRLSLKM